MPNRLAAETSPYLLQHRDNPVDWYPWGPEAIEKAKSENKALLVSIGYSACHWCHVMAHESFADPAIADLMNRLFVPVKVDREERPDVDAMCMEACQAMTGRGGWPLNAFLTPGLVPFHVGTYFPPEERHGMPSWRGVLLAVAEAWDERREEIEAQGPRMLHALSSSVRIEPAEGPITAEALDHALENLASSYDQARGGWGGAPKFPPTSTVEFLLARGEREMALGTLRAMAAGGIYDQLAGGFSRYSVDANWTVPHFEKMLYDNALLARAYLHGWLASGESRLREVCEQTLDWVLADLHGPEGGFCSALDADSEGVEGKHYVWSLSELRAAAGDLADVAIAYFGATEAGNFEHGLNVLEARNPPPLELPEIRRRLLEARQQRVRPGLDDKRLTSWNALTISALAEAGATLERPELIDAARACAEFLLTELRDPDGHLLRTWKDGRAHLNGYLEDYAHLLEALITLYEASFEGRWYIAAVSLADAMIERFSDHERGGFFTTAAEQHDLPLRRKDLEDTPHPSGSSAAAFGLLRLGLLSGEGKYERFGLGVLRLVYPIAARHPHAFGHLLQAADFYVNPVREVAVVGPAPGRAELLRVVRGIYRPRIVLAAGHAGVVPLLEDREAVDGQGTAYVCERSVCQAPVTSPAELSAALM